MKNHLHKLFLISALMLTTSCLEQGHVDSASKAQKSADLSASAISQAPTFEIPGEIIDCSFNGAQVVDGTSVTAFQNSTVGFGSTCVSETRLCTSGMLSGSYAFASCQVGAAASCLFDGVTIAHGASVTAYTSSTVAFGQVCSGVAETRTCHNGVLSGSATFSNCNTNAARSCLFDGRTIPSGESVGAYESSTSQFGGSCTKESRNCNDGTLSGSFTFGSCTVDQAASCLLNGRTLAHGETAVAFATSSAAFGSACSQENRTCDNGTLSGSFTFDSCAVNTPASCSLNGSTVAHGTSVIAFESGSVGFGQRCQSEARSCSNGTLSGTFSNSACVVETAANCTLNGKTISHGQSIMTYAKARVPAGQKCQSETRTCSNGNLSGTSVFELCEADPIVVIDPPPTCLLNGKKYPSDITVTMYQSAAVAFGQRCVSESRQCLNGNFTGSFTNATCTVDAAASCSLNGKTIAHGSSITVFTSASVAAGKTCQSETRTCSNGVLSGHAVSETCVVENPPVDPVNPGTCSQSGIIWEFPKDCRGKCDSGNGLKKSRISRDGGQTWLVIQNNALPDDLKEIYKYMLKQNGKNQCGRPNVTYTASQNTGYVILDTRKIPDCKVCRFVEVEEEKPRHHGQCGRKKEIKKQTVLKFLCGEIKKQKHHGKDDDDDDHNHKHGHHHGRHHGRH